MTSNDSPSTGSEFLNVLTEKAEQMTETARVAATRSQQAVIEALANWAVTTQTLISQQQPTTEALKAAPKPAELVDRGFEIAEQLLQAQHTFTKKLMESVQGPLAQAATMAASATQDTPDTATTSTATASTDEPPAAGDAKADKRPENADKAADTITRTVKNAFATSDPQAS